ncbi:NHL domain-containing thioredoxin family protein [Nocardioides sp. ChNu-99]|uniref:NHL domain-containing thioredoxin family protein n=1 Tax=Nocardioides sp. ChNu-99 TaxID=2839897 RepID=UPI002406BA94|nr:NHL domain-containing thioredoxin family protein [Nocardioides sp. ChNu-99]MDF9715905.1 NHL domain-containing thioredoxin family protein [Nocardioides sp. ChNu-99]
MTRNDGTVPRVRAPELRGRGWLNVAEPLTLGGLRGRFVLLDFWTFCCVNCLHVLDELRPVEEKHADHLVVVGVHSPKFVHEADPDALVAAVERYDVAHPVLDDPELVTWQAYTARAWPTLVLVDPEGYVVAQYAGEGHAHAVDRLLDELVAEHRERGTLQPGDSPYVPPPAVAGDLRFPAKAVPLPDGRVLVADAGHDEVVELAGADGPVLRRFGGFREPNGVCLLPADVAQRAGYDVVVADTVAHRLVGLALADGGTRVLAGDGTQWMQGDGTERLSSPWDVVWWRDRVWVAMAGIHQLWTLDPLTGAVEVAAGTTNEGLLDGPLASAWFAQTSGLAVDGDRLWLADSETSSLRWVDGTTGEVRTAVGSGLFDFGFRDGPGGHDEDAGLLQHPLGVTVLPDGSVAVCDTYNGAVRRFDPRAGERGELTTLATDLAEPSGAHVEGDHLVVVESTAHRLTRVALGGVVATDGFAHTTQRPVTEVAGGVELVVAFTPPPGQKVDDRFGPPSQLHVSATPPALLRDGEGRGTDLVRRLVLDPAVGEGVLHVAARAASCDVAPDGVPAEGAACHLHQQDWGVPVRVSADGPAQLLLPLGGEG